MWVLLFIQQYPHKKELQNGRIRIYSVLTNSITYHLGCKRPFNIKAYKEKDKGKKFLHLNILLPLAFGILFPEGKTLFYCAAALGGRAAEIVLCGREVGASIGASGDLQNASALVQQMICTYGMNEDFGLTCISSSTAMSGELFPLINEAKKQVLNDEMEQAISIISENKDKMERLVDALPNNNHLIGKEIEAKLNA